MLMQKKRKKEKKKRIMCCCLLGDPSEKINVQRKQKDGNIKEVPSPIIGQMYNKFNYAVRGHCHPGFTTGGKQLAPANQILLLFTLDQLD